ncbi:hypothetical protein ACIQZO_23390 [Streptomyces sp. NPDC097617]|uniref:hypothetical protein n=1 Tax=Streptomyces sp. NPDC097617 TaxID=3366091 RepID=UPI0038225D48
MFLSLNGPDTDGKTTQLRLLDARFPSVQLPGSAHEYDAASWERVASEDYAAWWFKQSTTAELTGLLLTSSKKQAVALEPGRVGLLDRGMPILIALSAATASVKEDSSSANGVGEAGTIFASADDRGSRGAPC